MKYGKSSNVAKLALSTYIAVDKLRSELCNIVQEENPKADQFKGSRAMTAQPAAATNITVSTGCEESAATKTDNPTKRQ
jgi:hypothetical protein